MSVLQNILLAEDSSRKGSHTTSASRNLETTAHLSQRSQPSLLNQLIQKEKDSAPGTPMDQTPVVGGGKVPQLAADAGAPKTKKSG